MFYCMMPIPFALNPGPLGPGACAPNMLSPLLHSYPVNICPSSELLSCKHFKDCPKQVLLLLPITQNLSILIAGLKVGNEIFIGY